MVRSGKLVFCPRGDACRPRVEERHNGIGGLRTAMRRRSSVQSLGRSNVGSALQTVSEINAPAGLAAIRRLGRRIGATSNRWWCLPVRPSAAANATASTLLLIKLCRMHRACAREWQFRKYYLKSMTYDSRWIIRVSSKLARIGH